ncbi:hypothetical protein Tco_1485454 [Tanacetum coccineum]
MNVPNPNNAMLDLLPFNIPAAPVIPNLIPQDPRQRQGEENLQNWNWDTVIDVDMTLDKGDVGGFDLEELFGLGLDDEDIMPNLVGPNINAQRQNTVQVLNRHRVYNIMNGGTS